MAEPRKRPRWDVTLPVVALVAASVMVAFAWMAASSARERARLALDGRVLGVAHRVELALRDQGLEAASQVLQAVLQDAAAEVSGLRLLSPDGRPVAAAGEPGDDGPLRRVTLFLGPGGRGGGPPAGFTRGAGSHGGARLSGGASGARRGRGRYTLEISLRRGVGGPPLAARLILPVAALAGLVLVALAVLAGRLLERQRLEVLEAAQRRRLEELGRAGAGLAHQLRTPLATIKGSCQMAAEDVEDPPVRRRLEVALEQVQRMERMLGRLLDFARPPRPEPETVEMGPFLEELAGRWSGVRAGAGSACVARADREHLVQILENLVENALAVSPEGEAVEITAASRGGRVVVTVADRGPGPGEDPEALFQPYLTGRADGSGLGLPIARNLAEANGGSLVLRPRAGGGTEAVLELPAEEERP